MLSLAENVYFRLYGEQNYVRDVAHTKDYIMNDTSYDIMRCIKDNQPCEIQDIIRRLSDIYNVEDYEEFSNDISDFIMELIDYQLIESDEVPVTEDEYLRGIIQQKCFETHQLFSACLELTYRCNEKCIHCYVDSKPEINKELSTSEIYDVIDQLNDMGCMGVLLTGGESTLREDLLDIAKYVKNSGMLVDIYTNGYSVSEDMIDRLIELKPNSVSFSFYGGTPEVHDKITAVPGSFDKSLKTMMTIKCAGIDTYIKSVVIKDNIDDYENLLKIGQRLGIKVRGTISIMPTQCGKQADRFRLLDLDSYIRVLSLEEKYGFRDFTRQPSKRGRYICASGLDSLSIDPFGNVHPCNAHPYVLGNIRTTKLRDIWENSEELKKMKDIHPCDLSKDCKDCEDYDYCTVCVGSAIRENGKLAPCSDTCTIAQAYHCMYKKHNKEVNNYGEEGIQEAGC